MTLSTNQKIVIGVLSVFSVGFIISQVYKSEIENQIRLSILRKAVGG